MSATTGEGMLQNAPMEAASSGTDTGMPGKLSFLSASWVNQRIMNVLARVEKYRDLLIDDGLYADGYLPFESPITDDMLMRMAPEQFRAIFNTIPSLEGKAALLDRMKGLKLPPRILLPFEASLYPPARPGIGAVAAEPPSPVSSSAFS